MAKRKSKISLKQIFSFIAILCGLATIAMIFLPSIKTGESTISGLNVVFGYEYSTNIFVKISKQVLDFSFLNLLMYILVLFGVILSVFTLTKSGRKNKLIPLLSGILYIGAGVMFFFTINFIVVNTDMPLESMVAEEYVKSFKESCSLGVGAIISGVLSIIAGGCSVVSGIMKK